MVLVGAIKFIFMERCFNLKSAKPDKKLKRFLAEIKKELDNFFAFQIKEPTLFFANNRADFDLLFGRKTEQWLVGVAKNNNIFMFDQKNYAKESSHQTKDFWQTLKHEYCHIYYSQITTGGNPLWLNEGVACYLSGKKLIIGENTKKKLLNIFDYFSQFPGDAYVPSQFWVELLIKKYGAKRLVTLIKALNIKEQLTPSKFAKTFFEVYGLKFNKTEFTKLRGV